MLLYMQWKISCRHFLLKTYTYFHWNGTVIFIVKNVYIAANITTVIFFMSYA